MSVWRYSYYSAKEKIHEMQVIMDHLQSTNLKSLVVGTCMLLYLPHFCPSPQDSHETGHSTLSSIVTESSDLLFSCHYFI